MPLSPQALNFGNLPPECSDPDHAKVCVVPFPYEATTSYRGGTKDGPAALLMASAQVELYDDELDWSPYEVGIATTATLWPSRENYDAPMRQLEGVVDAALERGMFPIVLGGEHAITVGSVRAALKRWPDLAVLQIDAHADLRQAYEDTPHSHASAMARLVDLGVPLVQVGIRNISAEEMAWWREKQPSTIFWARDYCRGRQGPAEVLAALGDRPVFLTIDLDGLDPAVIPGVGTPEPGGLGWWETLDLLRTLFRSKQVVGCDVVELAPIAGENVSEFAAAKLVYKLIGYKFEGSRPHD
ncbi:MAG: agmatinase [Candidatus Sericytochromatia bacterium]|nr:agmatinase [Candidatus Sericytochromatia bacterium]